MQLGTLLVLDFGLKKQLVMAIVGVPSQHTTQHWLTKVNERLNDIIGRIAAILGKKQILFIERC